MQSASALLLRGKLPERHIFTSVSGLVILKGQMRGIMNDDNEMLPASIRFHYQLAPEAKLQTAHGVWGGINPHGEIEMSFYHESDALPRFTEQIIAPDGSMEHEVADNDGETRHIVRHVHSRILLNYNTARAVLEWLEDRIDELDHENGGLPFQSSLEQ